MSQPPYQQQPYQQPQQGYQQPAQGYGQAPAQRGWPSAGAGPGPWSGRQKVAGGLLIGGSLLAILGSFLPWVNVTVDTFDESANGFGEGASDGYVILVAALVAIVFGALSFQMNPPRRGVIILGLISAVVFLYIGLANFGEIGDQAPGIETFGGEVNTGIGLILVIVAGLIALAGGIVAILAQRAVNTATRAAAEGGQPPYGRQPQAYGQQPQQGWQQGQYPPPQQPQQPQPGQYQPPQQPQQPQPGQYKPPQQPPQGPEGQPPPA
jgi:hypothetical protein